METLTQTPDSSTQKAPGTNAQASMPVTGMTCAACAISAESIVANTPGVSQANVNFATQTLQVTYNPKQVKVTDMQKALQSIGYDLITDTEDAQGKQEEAQQTHYQALKKKTLLAGLLTLPVVIIGMFFMDLPYGNWVMMALSAPVLFYFGRNFFVNAFRQARHGRANMDTLVALSTGTAFVF